MEFLTDWGVVIALACAGAAVVYGFVTSRWLLSLSPGNDEMQKISLAVQQGATAYLRRQYTIIGGVAVVLAIVLAIALEAQGSEKEAGRYLGRTEFDSVEVDNEVVVHSRKQLPIGEFVNVKITKAYDYDLEGEVVE